MKTSQLIKTVAWLMGGTSLAFGTLPIYGSSLPLAKTAGTTVAYLQAARETDSSAVSTPASTPPVTISVDATQTTSPQPACTIQDNCGAQPVSDPEDTPHCTIQDNCGAQPINPDEEQTQAISGTVRIGPNGGPCRVDQPCDRPYQTTLAVTDTSGHFVIVNSDADGHFFLNVAPGQYTVSQYDGTNPPPSGTPPTRGGTGWPRCDAVTITVAAGQTVPVEIDCNSGMV